MSKYAQELFDLKAALQQGLSVVFPVWAYKTKDWVTSICAADTDNDGDTEVVIGSHDGRVHVLTSEGVCQWERIIGNKRPIGSVVGIAPREGKDPQVSALVGTQDGKVYALDRMGQTISKDGKTVYAVDQSGRAIEQEQEVQAFWHSSDYEIRYLSVDAKQSSRVVIDSDARRVYTLDYATGAHKWEFSDGGVISAVFSTDITKDGDVETLVASNNCLYILDKTGCVIHNLPDVPGQIHMIYGADVDNDRQIEVLLGTDGKVLSVYRPYERKKVWDHTFPNRFLAVDVADVDGDGRNEVLVGSEDKHLYILDAATGKVLWRHYLGCSIFSICTYDIDHDDRVEVLIGTQDSRVYCYRIPLVKGLDERIRTLYQKSGKPKLASLEGELTAEQCMLLQHLITEIRSNTPPVTLELVIKQVDEENYLDALSNALYLKHHKVQWWWGKEQPGPVHAVDLADISRDTRKEVIVAAKDSIYAFNVRGTELWPYQVDGKIRGLVHGYLDPTSKWSQVIAATDYEITVLSGVMVNKKGRARVGCERKESVVFQERIKTLCINAYGKKNGTIEIFVAFEGRKVCKYERDLRQATHTIEAPQRVRALASHLTEEKGVPELVLGSSGDVDHAVYAYEHRGVDPLWRYGIRGRVEALCIKDIDGDKRPEVIVGSQDRNIHVIDQNGKLKWRYYLPDCVKAVEVYDVDGDSKMEILAGCRDGQLYVLSRNGDLLWSYKTKGSILALRIGDIDNDEEHIEIVIGTENGVEVVRVVNQDRVQKLINGCWEHLQARRESCDALIQECLAHQSPLVRAFAFRKLAERSQHQEQEFNLIEAHIKDGSVEVRKALAHVLVTLYRVDPQRTQKLFDQISKDPDRTVKLSLVKHIAELMCKDKDGYWDNGFRYLQRLARNNDRFVRRAVMREMYKLVKDFHYIHYKSGRKRAVFDLLLTGLLEPESTVIEASEWVRQEAARTLAHFLDNNHNDLIMYLNLLITRGVRREIIERIAYHATIPFIEYIFKDLGGFVFELDEDNVRERLSLAVNALEKTKSLRYGQDTLRIYKELQRLLAMNTIDDIALYQCTLKDERKPENVHLKIVLNLLHHLNSITRPLSTYLRREDLKDRVDSLLAASNSIESTLKLVEREYAKESLGTPLSRLPDKTILTILLQGWHTLVTSELYRLSGKAELEATLQTQTGYFEERVVIWLLLHNKGRVAADTILVELVSNEQFEVLGSNTFSIETIPAGDEVTIELVIKPNTYEPNLTCEITYSDIEDAEKRMYKDMVLSLHAPQQVYRPIPNIYSTGAPRPDMCFGREDDLSFLTDNLTRSAATLLILHGQRRSGKTTLLFQLANTPALQPHIPLLIDMQDLAYTFSQSTFFYTIAFRIAQALGKRGIDVSPGEQEDFREMPTFALDRFLDIVEDKLGERKIIILIDEFEVLETQVERKALAPEIFDFLRSLVQHRQKLTFLFSGVHSIDQLTSDYWSTFFNIAMHYRLSRLSEQGAMSLITQPVQGFLEYEPYAIKKIRQLTADQPYLIHLLCRPLVDYCNEHEKTYVTLNDVNTILEGVVEDSSHFQNSSHFQWIWKECTGEERLLLAVLAEVGGEEGRSQPLIELVEHLASHNIHYKREQILSALQKLIERDIVTLKDGTTQNQNVEEERYQISVGLLRSWLRTAKKVRQVLREDHTPLLYK